MFIKLLHQMIIRVHFCRRDDQNVPFTGAKMKLGVPMYRYTVASSLRMQNRPLLQTKFADVVVETSLPAHSNFPKIYSVELHERF